MMRATRFVNWYPQGLSAKFGTLTPAPPSDLRRAPAPAETWFEADCTT
jgi:hypothetical protein